MIFRWSPEACEDLRKLCLQGVAYSQMSVQLSAVYGFVSRSAVIGKAARLGLSGVKPMRARMGRPRERTRPARRVAGTDADRRKTPRPRKKPFTFDSGTPKPPGINDLAPDTSPHAVTIMRLRDGVCRWPLGDPTPDMLYCGAPCPTDSAYCARHTLIAFDLRDCESAPLQPELVE